MFQVWMCPPPRPPWGSAIKVKEIMLNAWCCYYKFKIAAALLSSMDTRAQNPTPTHHVRFMLLFQNSYTVTARKYTMFIFTPVQQVD